MNAAKPQRIATLLASATEIVYGLGLGEWVVAVSHECDWPADAAAKPRVTRSNVDSAAASGQIDRQVKEMTAAGRALYNIDEARLALLAPDLIVTQSQCDVCAVRYEEVLAAVERNPSLHTAQVIALNPMSLDEVFKDILRLGAAAGAQAAAESYAAQLRARVEAVRAKTAGLADHERPRIAVIEWSEPLMLAANWTPELVEIAGGVHHITTAGRHSTYTQWRDLIDYQPEVLIVAPCGFDLARSMGDARELARQPWRRALSAVSGCRVLAVDGNAYLNRSGPRLVDTLEILAHLIHPERFPPPRCVAHREGVWRELSWEELERS